MLGSRRVIHNNIKKNSKVVNVTSGAFPEWKSLGETVQVLDNLRKPVSAAERQLRIDGKSKLQLYPYYGATGQVGWIDGYITDGNYILIGEDGAPFLDKIKSKAYEVNGKSWVNNHAHILSGNEGVTLNKYILYYLNSIDYRPFVNGTTRLKLTKSALLTIPIPIYPLEVQQQIVSKIEELFSELDKSIEQLKAAQQQLKVYRQAVLKWAFEGRLTNDNVKDRELPEGWKLVKIQDLAESKKHALKAGPFGSSLKKEFYTSSGYKIYGQEQVINNDAFFGDYYISEERYQELSSCRVKPFDILISLVGTVGKVLLLPEDCQPGIINPRLIKISLNTEIYSPKFFKYYFESSTVKSFYGAETRGTTMDVLNLGLIKTIPFPLCSLEEQQQIVQEIESRLSLSDKLEATISDNLQTVEVLRQSLLSRAFLGLL